MKSVRLLLAFLFTITVGSVATAQNAIIVQYINTYKHAAIAEMKRTGVPASIKLAQGILETQAGQSDLVKRSNNHFGIKCKTRWDGEKVYHDDDERGECFRAYGSALDSYKDHSDFLKNSQRYAFLFNINPENYKEWAKGLKKAGYATNPQYWQKLVKYIEDYNLNLYTQIAIGKKQFSDEPALYASVGNTVPMVQQTVYLDDATETEPLSVSDEDIPEAPEMNYPQTVFRINDTRVIAAKAGTSLLAIAEEHDIRFKQLLDFNDLPHDADILQKDQLIFLQRKRKHGAKDLTVLYRNETLYDVAQREGIRLDDLLAYNQLDETNVPQHGTQLYLKKHHGNKKEELAKQTNFIKDVNAGRNTNAKPASSKPTTAQKYIVKNGDTLYGIAKKYGVTITQLKDWNRLKSDGLKPGQQLIINKSM